MSVLSSNVDGRMELLARSAFAAVRCPECGKPLDMPMPEDGYGVGRCACREFPLAAGVLVADPGELQSELIETIRSGRRSRARRLILDSHGRKARMYEALHLQPTFERFVRHRLISEVVNRCNLQPLLEKLPPRRIMDTLAAAAQWNIYIRHRFTSPPMLATTALLGLVKDCQGYVMDAPCGMGHLAFMMSKLTDPRRLVCMDLSPAFVYAARRFFVPDLGAAIVHDMNNPLPLADGQFGAIFCSDAFHYVLNRDLLAREFMRLLRDDGVLVLAHVHNRLQRTDYAGYPLAPAEYARLFQDHHVRIFPEGHLLDACLDNRPVDLAQQFDEQELNRHRVLYVVAAKSPDALRVVAPVRDDLNAASRNVRVNGLYRMRRGAGMIVFELNLPEGLRNEYAECRPFLPQSVTVDSSKLLHDAAGARFGNQRELLEQYVLVDVPKDY